MKLSSCAVVVNLLCWHVSTAGGEKKKRYVGHYGSREPPIFVKCSCLYVNGPAGWIARRAGARYDWGSSAEGESNACALSPQVLNSKCWRLRTQGVDTVPARFPRNSAPKKTRGPGPGPTCGGGKTKSGPGTIPLSLRDVLGGQNRDSASVIVDHGAAFIRIGNRSLHQDGTDSEILFQSFTKSEVLLHSTVSPQ
jgi:hypothetical protein